MAQVCSILKCSAVIPIPECQEVAMFDNKTVCEKCYGKPLCAKCDRLLHAPLPPIPTRQIMPQTYEEPEAYKQEVIHTYLPRPKPGYAIRRVQFADGEGRMRHEYISCRVKPEKRRTVHAKLLKCVKKLFHFTQRGSQN
ncbi:hypothetical protein BDR05DRAFT_961240 [Suillus weaverae]|nr:hypothetical protein BDR05DRAFT_961240 [Suillus weaverae]